MLHLRQDDRVIIHAGMTGTAVANRRTRIYASALSSRLHRCHRQRLDRVRSSS